MDAATNVQNELHHFGTKQYSRGEATVRTNVNILGITQVATGTLLFFARNMTVTTRPKTCIMQPWIRKKKSSSAQEPGWWSEKFQA
jgi:hypothetical protein